MPKYNVSASSVAFESREELDMIGKRLARELKRGLPGRGISVEASGFISCDLRVDGLKAEGEREAERIFEEAVEQMGGVFTVRPFTEKLGEERQRWTPPGQSPAEGEGE